MTSPCAPICVWWTQLWTEDRPALPSGMAFAYPEDYAGLSVRKKLQLVREKMEKLRLDYYVVGALDSLCWLYNLRGSDVDTSPLFTGFAMICQDEAVLFGDRERIPIPWRLRWQRQACRFCPAMIFTRKLQHCPDGAGSGFSARTVNAAIYDNLGERVDRVLLEDDIVEHLKMVKNHVELQHIRTAHKHDGVAMVRFLMWLEKAIKTGRPDRVEHLREAL